MHNLNRNHNNNQHHIEKINLKKGHEREHPAGNHKYPVQFTLPANLPSSYIGLNGYIRYTVKVHVDVAWKFDSKFSQEFNVVAPIDLNHYAQIQNALRVEHSKQFTCCCIPIGGHYDIAISLPCIGYSNEQKIPISVECTNRSNVYIRGLKVALRKLVTYHSTTPHKESKRDDIKLSVIKFAISIDKQETKQFTGELLVPPSTALNLDHCNLIEISHRLEVSSLLTGCRSNFVFDIPVTIGHFPYANHPCCTTTTLLPYTNGSSGSANVVVAPPARPSSLNPPTYEMAMLTTLTPTTATTPTANI